MDRLSACSLTRNQLDFASAIASFCGQECGTREQRYLLSNGGLNQHSTALYLKLAETGLLRMCLGVDEQGRSHLVELCLLLEETAWSLAPVAGLGTSAVVADVYSNYGSLPQRNRVLEGLREGQVGAIAISEPDAGSDIGSIKCAAERLIDGWRISGVKSWCSYADIADTVVILVRTSPSLRSHDGLSMMEVPLWGGGVHVESVETLGRREVSRLTFSNCEISDESVIGTVGEGLIQVTDTLNVERLLIASRMLGVAQRAFDEAVQHVKTRYQFGKSIGSNQAIRHRIADLATEIESAKSYVFGVIRTAEKGDRDLLLRETAIAKLKASAVARTAALECLQMMGAHGATEESELNTILNTALLSSIYGGTSEIQREIIGRSYGL